MQVPRSQLPPKTFQQEMHEVLVAPTEAGACGDTELRFVLHSIRGDAANSAVLHGSKVHSTEVQSTFTCVRQSAPTSVATHTAWGDAQHMGCGTGMATRATYIKQLRGLGVPTWLDVIADPKYQLGDCLGPTCSLAHLSCQEERLLHNRAPVGLECVVFHVFAFTRDRGSDETLLR